MTLENLNVLIVGAGFYGATIAERLFNDAGIKNILVIDKRDTIGGNCHDYECPNTGVLVHKYGSHIFHTRSNKVWNYVNQFCEFNSYRHRVLTRYKGEMYPMPINLETINRFSGKKFKPKQAELWLNDEQVTKKNPANFEEKAVSQIGWGLYEAFIFGYTCKQWGRLPTGLPASIFNRLPIHFNYNSDYFNDQYQGIPIGGYTKVFEKMLEGIPVKLGVDYSDVVGQLPKDCLVVYTGPIDALFDYKFGKLDWRSLRFEVETKIVSDYQGMAVINEADRSVPYTRTHEFKHYHPERTDVYQNGGTVISREYSIENGDPYYPVRADYDLNKLKQYQELAEENPNLYLGGRLGEYKYYDMTDVIAKALSDYTKLKKRLTK